MEAKPYLVLARKYRPQTFDDVAGQETIATTLKNAITLKKIGHAYLFTGPRGVGKTSMARIFAKSLNCVNGPTIEPCGKCPACKEIEASRALDVLEIDGASNRGIDEIRALRENVKFAPSSGKYKIYIIDEVHQITNDGFNALLKTLEEPPAHVKFIFATTSAQKVPATILSRCQRFDFRRIATDKIAGVLAEICKKEKIRCDEEALFMIAKAADGSLRDSQTILDQIAASTENEIRLADVVRSLGMLEEEKIVEIVDALKNQDAKTALLLLDAVLKEGKDPGLFLDKMLEHVRNLLFLQVSPELISLIDATESYQKSLLRQKDLFNKNDLFYFFSVIQHALQTLRRFEAKRIPLEVMLVKLSMAVPTEELADILAELKSLEKKTLIPVSRSAAAPLPAPVASKPKPLPQAESQEEEREDEELPPSDMEITPPAFEKSVSFDAVWSALVQAVKAEKMSIGSYLAEGEPGTLQNGKALIGFPERFTFFKESLEVPDNRRLVEKHLSKIVGQEISITFEVMKELNNRKRPEAPAEAASIPKDDPAIQSAMQIFGGRMI